MTRKSRAVEMRNAILRNYLNQIIMKTVEVRVKCTYTLIINKLFIPEKKTVQIAWQTCFIQKITMYTMIICQDCFDLFCHQIILRLHFSSVTNSRQTKPQWLTTLPQIFNLWQILHDPGLDCLLWHKVLLKLPVRGWYHLPGHY